MFSRAYILYAAVCALFLTACAHKALPPQFPGSSVPFRLARNTDGSSQATSPPAWGLVSNGGSMQSFGDAHGLPLTTDADYARFIDPAVVGSDRNLAIKLLKFMPPEMRGDFIYVNQYGRILSNRIALQADVHFFKRIPNAEQLSQSAAVTSRSAIHPMAYPPSGGSGGPYLRYYSYQGVNAAYGYASFPCDSVYNNSDNGNMYFNAYDTNGSDVLDAGVSQGLFPNNSQTESAFLNVAGTYQYQSWNGYTGWSNESQRWQCGLPPSGAPLGMMYGTLPATLSNGSQNLSFLAVGIPDFDPTQMLMPPSQATWNHSAWDFFDTPPTLLGSAGSWDGIPSPCMFCAVARMITIAQNSGTPLNDGSCVGACQGAAAARWDEVVMGEIVSPCAQNPGSPPSATCTIEYPSNGVWQNGANDLCQGGIFYSEYNQQDALEGINANYSTCNSSTSSQSAFKSSLPAAPSSPCTPDSYGYCDILQSSGDTGTRCDTGTMNHGQEVYLYDKEWSYYIFKAAAMLELQETAVKNETYTFDGNVCNMQTSWSPGEPKIQYNDTNLP